MEGQNYSVKERLEQLEALMGKYSAGGKDLCVAFSGGVDSSLILKAAVKAATKDGSKVYAVTFDSRLHPSCDLEIANRVAAELGGVHKVIHVNELEQDSFIKDVLGRELSTKMIDSHKKAYHEYCMQVTDWEIANYLHKI